MFSGENTPAEFRVVRISIFDALYIQPFFRDHLLINFGSFRYIHLVNLKSEC